MTLSPTSNVTIPPVRKRYMEGRSRASSSFSIADGDPKSTRNGRKTAVFARSLRMPNCATDRGNANATMKLRASAERTSSHILPGSRPRERLPNGAEQHPICGRPDSTAARRCVDSTGYRPSCDRDVHPGRRGTARTHDTARDAVRTEEGRAIGHHRHARNIRRPGDTTASFLRASSGDDH